MSLKVKSNKKLRTGDTFESVIGNIGQRQFSETNRAREKAGINND